MKQGNLSVPVLFSEGPLRVYGFSGHAQPWIVGRGGSEISFIDGDAPWMCIRELKKGRSHEATTSTVHIYRTTFITTRNNNSILNDFSVVQSMHT